MYRQACVPNVANNNFNSNRNKTFDTQLFAIVTRIKNLWHKLLFFANSLNAQKIPGRDKSLHLNLTLNYATNTTKFPLRVNTNVLSSQ